MVAGAPAIGETLMGRAWTLQPGTSVRAESWGAILYNYGTRRLATVRDHEVADCVTAMIGGGLAVTDSGSQVRLERALTALESSGFVRLVEGSAVPSLTPARESRPSPISAASTSDLHRGLRAPICLTWEWTYACNLSCGHCLSSSGRRDSRELTAVECERIIDELQAMKVFYINVGGGEPTIRPDFWHLLDYAVEHDVGVKFSTNGIRLNSARAAHLAAMDYVDVQISLDGATAEVNDRLRGPGSFAAAIRALENLAEAGFSKPKISVVMTRDNIAQLDEFKSLATRYGAVLRLTRLRPSGRGAQVWDQLRLLPEQQRQLYDWLMAEGEGVMTGDSFFHLSAYGERLPGMNMCGAGRVVCLIDPIGDVYACPFAMHERFRAGNVRPSGFGSVWQEASLFDELREPQSAGACQSCAMFDNCRGGCMAAKFFTGRRLEDPDPECVAGHSVEPSQKLPFIGPGHSRPPVVRGRVVRLAAPIRYCATDPVDVAPEW